MRPLRELNGTATCGAARGAGRWAAPGRGVRSEGRGAASGGASRGPGGSPPHSGPPGGGLGWSRNRRRCGTAPMRRPHTALPRVRTGTPRGKPAAARGGGEGGGGRGRVHRPCTPSCAHTPAGTPCTRELRTLRPYAGRCAPHSPGREDPALRPARSTQRPRTAPSSVPPISAPHCSSRAGAVIVPSRPPPSPPRAPPGPVHRAHLRAGRRQVEGGGPQLLGVLQAG